jgi:hypothetical protein
MQLAPAPKYQAPTANKKAEDKKRSSFAPGRFSATGDGKMVLSRLLTGTEMRLKS